MVGNTVTLNWTETHDVTMCLTEAEFTSCTCTGDVTPTTVSTFSYTAATEDAGKTLYMICSVGKHCENNQKLKVMVAGGSMDMSPWPPGAEVVEPCADNAWYPLYLSETAANAASPSKTSHPGNVAGTWMPMGPTMYHGDLPAGGGEPACLIADTPCQVGNITYPLFYTEGQAMDAYPDNEIQSVVAGESGTFWHRPNINITLSTTLPECLKISGAPRIGSPTTSLADKVTPRPTSGSAKLGHWAMSACALLSMSWLALAL